MDTVFSEYRHTIGKCNHCTISDMKNESWCSLNCELRNLLLSLKENNNDNENVLKLLQEYREELHEL